MTPQTTFIIEVIQLVSATIGLGFSFWAIYCVVENILETTDSPPEDLRRLVGLIAFRRQLHLLLAHGILVIIGVVSVMKNNVTEDIATEVGIVRLALMCLTLILCWDSVVERMSRRSFRERANKIKSEKLSHEIAILVNGKTAARGDMEIDPEPLVTRHQPEVTDGAN